jgi:hypothetical protein
MLRRGITLAYITMRAGIARTPENRWKTAFKGSGCGSPRDRLKTACLDLKLSDLVLLNLS